MNLSIVDSPLHRRSGAIRRLLFIALMASACHESHDANQEAYCVETVSQYAFDDIIPELGQTASSFLQLGEARQGQLTWTGDSPVLTIHPKEGTSELTLSIEENPLGHARFIHSEKEGAGRLHCPNRVELDTLLRLETIDGALMDTWQTVAQKISDEPTSGLSIESNITDTPFQGNFSMDLNEDEAANWDTASLWMTVYWHSTMSRGQMLFQATQKLPDDPNEPGITGGIIFQHIIADFEAPASDLES